MSRDMRINTTQQEHPFIKGDQQLDFGRQPDTVDRHCTDCPCCLVFLAALVGYGYVLLYAFENGDPTRFQSLPNADGLWCGRSPEVKDSPLLYFCRDKDGGLHPKNTVCVDECPTAETLKKHTCPRGESMHYHTRPVGSLLCMPKDAHEAKKMMEEWDNPVMESMLEWGTIVRTWQPILISAAAAIILGFFYLFFLEKCASCIVWLGLFTLVAVLGAAGGYLIYASQNLGADGLIGTKDSEKDLYIGIAACVLSFLFACLGCCCKGRAADTALNCIQEASDCIQEMPSLLFQPFIDLLFKIILITASGIGFIYLLSCVQEVPEYTTVTGHTFTLKYEPEEYGYIAYYAFVTIWLVEIFSAMSQFVISYAVQLWFCASPRGRRGGPLKDTAGVPCCATFQGFFVGLFYHLGTFAFGSFVISVFSVLRDLMQLLTKEAADGNPAVACCSCCCSLCLDCFTRFLQFMNKTAYMDVAINSNGFCKAGYHAVTVLKQLSSEVVTLNAATIMFQFTGVGGIAAAGAAICHLMCTRWDRFSDSSSPMFVEDPIPLDIVSAVVCGVVAWPFMLLMDHVADTILFCCAIEKLRTPPPPPPRPDYDEFQDQQGACFGCCGGPKPNRERIYNSNEMEGLLPKQRR